MLFSLSDTSSSEMEQNTTKVDATTSELNEVRIHDKRFGRGAVSSGLTHECGVFGVVGNGKWPTTVSFT